MRENIKVNDKNISENYNNDNNIKHKNIEIWEDLVNIKDLIIAIMICIITTFGGYLAAPNESYKPLLFGLIGAMIGFIICSIIIKPKRRFVEDEGELR